MSVRLPKEERRPAAPEVSGAVANATLERVGEARIRLMFVLPFLGYLVSQLRDEVSNSVGTAGTDGKRIIWSPDWVATLSEDDLKFVMAHEAMHCALSHLWRRGDRDPNRWNIAADAVINDLLIEAGLKSTIQGTITGGKGRSTEQVYEDDDIPRPPPPPPPPGGGGRPPPPGGDGEPQPPGGGGRPPPPGGRGEPQPPGEGPEGEPGGKPGKKPGKKKPKKPEGPGGRSGEEPQEPRAPDLGPSEPQERPRHGTHGGFDDHNPWEEAGDDEITERKWKEKLASSQQYSGMPAGMKGMVRDLLYPKADWRWLLQNGLSFPDDYRAYPYDRRFPDVFLPTLSGLKYRVVVAIDTSGSMVGAKLDEFWAEIVGIARNADIDLRVMTCDADIQNEWHEDEFDPGLVRMVRGGGGTSFVPPFERIEDYTREGWIPDAVVYLTDLQGLFPGWIPSLRVFWVINKVDEPHAPTPPFGEVIVIND